MKEYRYVSIFVDTTQVDGYIVSAERQVVTVEVISPLKGIIGQTVIIPKDFAHSKGYLDKNGYVTERGKAAAKRVLEEIYRGALFLWEKRESLLQLYENYYGEKQLRQEGVIGEEEKEELLYALFTYTITTCHRKISYDIFRQLVKKIVLET